MFWLLVIGLVHAYLIWDGDILVPYALCGLLLLWWVRRFRPGLCWPAAVLFLAVGAPAVDRTRCRVHVDAGGRPREGLEMWMPTRQQASEQLARLHGSYPRGRRASCDVRVHDPDALLSALLPVAVGGMMMLGMALYKWGFLDGRRPARDLRGGGGDVPSGGSDTRLVWNRGAERVRFAMPERTVADVWNYTGAVLTSIGYAAVPILMVKRGAVGASQGAGRRRTDGVFQLSFPERITSILFLGWGFGLAGRFDYARQLLVVAAIWAVQLIVSPIWLQRYRFGPAEWLWRSLTYWKRQPMRRDTSQSSYPGSQPASSADSHPVSCSTSTKGARRTINPFLATDSSSSGAGAAFQHTIFLRRLRKCVFGY